MNKYKAVIQRELFNIGERFFNVKQIPDLEIDYFETDEHHFISNSTWKIKSSITESTTAGRTLYATSYHEAESKANRLVSDCLDLRNGTVAFEAFMTLVNDTSLTSMLSDKSDHVLDTYHYQSSDTCHSCEGSAVCTCSSCSGSGRTDCYKCTGGQVSSVVSKPCRNCNGTARIEQYAGIGRVGSFETCPNCNSGQVSERTYETCRSCHGSRFVPCYQCDRSGELDCGACDGTGEITHWFTVTISAHYSKSYYKGTEQSMDWKAGVEKRYPMGNVLEHATHMLDKVEFLPSSSSSSITIQTPVTQYIHCAVIGLKKNKQTIWLGRAPKPIDLDHCFDHIMSKDLSLALVRVDAYEKDDKITFHDVSLLSMLATPLIVAEHKSYPFNVAVVSDGVQEKVRDVYTKIEWIQENPKKRDYWKIIIIGVAGFFGIPCIIVFLIVFMNMILK